MNEKELNKLAQQMKMADIENTLENARAANNEKMIEKVNKDNSTNQFKTFMQPMSSEFSGNTTDPKGLNSLYYLVFN